jgi:hypothetical protein
MIRSLAAALVLAASLGACGGTADVTGSGGQVSQFVAYRDYGVRPRLDVIVVVSTSSAKDGAALRASVATAMRTRMRQLSEGESWLRDLSNPIDVRGFVASAVDGSIRSSADVGALAWHEEDATNEGSDAFATAMESALRTAPDGEVSAAAVIETLDRTQAFAASSDETERLVVLVSTSDDPGAPGTAAPFSAKHGSSSVVVVPAAGGAACRPGPGLGAWAKTSEAVVQTPCSGLELQTVFVDYAASCLPRPLALAADGHGACRVRAFVPRGTACDAARGWRAPSAEASRTRDPSLADMDVCEVVELAGDEAVSCRVASSAWTGRASGWCVPDASRACGVASAPRIVGAAAPPFAHMEIACELSP